MSESSSSTKAPDTVKLGNRYELVAVLVAGGIHVVIDILGARDAARLWNAAVGAALAIYAVWRLRRNGELMIAWGIRVDNFWSAIGWHLTFGLPAMLVLIAWGTYCQRMPPPGSLLLAVSTYPLYGVVQQFALQNLVVRNLRSWIGNPVWRAFFAAVLFAASHVPLWPVVALSFVGGWGLTIVYERRPNLWAIGCWHGVLAAMAFHFVLGRTPAEKFLQWFSR